MDERRVYEENHEYEEEDEEVSYGEDGIRKKTRVVKRGSKAGCSVPPSCQVDNCNADLSGAKQYHRRHKVCEYHAKAHSVLIADLHQRFCQQCSRFTNPNLFFFFCYRIIDAQYSLTLLPTNLHLETLSSFL